MSKTTLPIDLFILLIHSNKKPVLALLKEIFDSNPEYINIRDNDGYTPLMFSISAFNNDLTKFLLDRGADLNAFALDGHTALHEMVSLKDIQGLIPYGPNLKMKNFDGATALDFYSRSRICDDDIINLLELHGAVPGSSPEAIEPTENQLADLKRCMRNQISTVVNVDIFKLAELRFGSFDGIVYILDLMYLILANERDDKGQTLLHRAVENSNEEVVKYLLLSGADVNAVDYNNTLPLQLCKSPSIRDRLLAKGAKICL